MIKTPNAFIKDNSIIPVHDIEEKDIGKLVSSLKIRNMYKVWKQQINLT